MWGTGEEWRSDPLGLYTCLPYRASICYEFQNTFKQKETGENVVEVCQNVLVENNRLIMLVRGQNMMAQGWSWSAVLSGRGRQNAVLIGRGRQRGVGGTMNHKGMCHPVVTCDWLAKESARTNQWWGTMIFRWHRWFFQVLCKERDTEKHKINTYTMT